SRTAAPDVPTAQPSEITPPPGSTAPRLRQTPRTTSVPARATARTSPGHLRIDLYTFFPGTLVVRDGSTDLGHTPVSKIERRGSSPGKLKGHVTTTFDLAPGRHALVITYLQDRRQPL